MEIALSIRRITKTPIPLYEIVWGSIVFLGIVGFSHIGILFWGPALPESWYGFEGVKRVIFLGGFGILYVGGLLSRRIRLGRLDTLALLGVSAITLIQMSGSGSFDRIIFGDPGFYMGTLFLVYLYLALRVTWALRPKSRIPLWSIWLAMGGVVLYTLVQWLGYDPIEYATSFEAGRVFSTFWNPNLLAGFLLLLLPTTVRLRWGIAGAISIVFGILMTLSLSCLIFAVGYLTWYYTRMSSISRWYITLLILIAGVGCMEILLGENGASKILSLMTRWTLFVEGIQYIRENPSVLIAGAYVGDFSHFFNALRSPDLLVYIPAEIGIEHTHFTPLDLLLRYGFLGVALMYMGVRTLRIRSSAWEPGILFLVFIVLHQPESTHYIVALWGVYSLRDVE